MSQIEAESTQPIPICASCARGRNTKLIGENETCLVRFITFFFSRKFKVCLGLFSPLVIEQTTSAIKARLKEMDFKDLSACQLAFAIPGATIVRQTLFIRRYKCTIHSIDVRENCKAVFANPIREIVAVADSSDSKEKEFTITISFGIDDENLRLCCADLSFAATLDPRRGEDILKNRSQLVSRLDCITEAQRAAFDFSLKQSPNITVSVQISREPVYVAGRYNKYARYLPQSPWTGNRKLDDKLSGARTNVSASSLQEKCCDPIVKLTKSDSCTFVTSGREDVDVRMLGTGRPFFVALHQCRDKRLLDDMSSVTQLVHDQQQDVRVSNLTLVTRAQTSQIVDGETEKTKSYCALVRVKCQVPRTAIEGLSSLGAVVCHQKTPVRVMGRRANLIRDRTIHSMNAIRLDADGSSFLLYMKTQAGTYIKEFINSDFGRSQPSLGTLLGLPLTAQLDCVELDVTHVDLVWPPMENLQPERMKEEVVDESDGGPKLPKDEPMKMVVGE